MLARISKKIPEHGCPGIVILIYLFNNLIKRLLYFQEFHTGFRFALAVLYMHHVKSVGHS